MNDQQLLQKIGHKIANLRRSKGWNQLDLAARCNFEKANMCRIETGRTNFTIRTLFIISQALEVKITALVDVE